MTQNTEQNVRTRDEQVDDLVEAMSDEVWVPDHKSYCEKMILEAEARGAAEERRKDAELSLAKLFCQNEQEASDRTPERPDVVQWQKDRNEFFLSSILEVVTEYAAWRDAKDAEGQEVVAWLIQDKSKGKPGCAYSPDRAVTDKAHADKAARFNNNVSGLYTHPTNVDALESERDKWRLQALYETDVAEVAIQKAAALEARIAELKEAEQLARADAEASNARVTALEAENASLARKVAFLNDPVSGDHYERPDALYEVNLEDNLSDVADESSRGDITRVISWRKLGPIFIVNASDEDVELFSAFSSEEEAETARAALTREGGV